MTLNTFTSGVNTQFSTELNQNFNHVNTVIDQITTSTDADAVQAGSGTTSNTFEFAEITGINKFVIIVLEINAVANSINGGTASCQIKLESKEDGGSYSDIFTTRTILSLANPNTSNATNNTNTTFIYPYEPTSAEMSDGLFIRVTGTATAPASGSATTSFPRMLILKD